MDARFETGLWSVLPRDAIAIPSRAEHRRLLADLDALATHAEHLAPSLVRHFVHDWLVGHIDSYDRPAARAIKAAA